MRFWADGRPTGSYPETGFAEIGAHRHFQAHDTSPKPTSGPEYAAVGTGSVVLALPATV